MNRTRALIPLALIGSTLAARADVIADAQTQVGTWSTALGTLGTAVLGIAIIFKAIGLARRALNKA